MAVPCWSSWKTGMSSSSRSRALDLEAARRGDVLEVDAAEDRRDELHGAHDLVDVLGVEADRPGVDVGEPLEQRRLALHDRQRGGRADVAEPEHGRAVGDDGDGVALDRQPPDVVGLRGDGQADPGDAGRVGHGQVVAGAQRHLRAHLDLAAEVQQEGPVADLADGDAVDARAAPRSAAPACSWSLAAQVTSTTMRSGCDSVTSSAVTAPPARADGGGQPADGGGVGRDLEPDGDRVRRAGDGHGGIVPRRSAGLRGGVGRVAAGAQAVVLNPVALTAAAQAASSWSPVPPLPPSPPTSTPSR